jgi:hypothetical protein
MRYLELENRLHVAAGGSEYPYTNGYRGTVHIGLCIDNNQPMGQFDFQMPVYQSGLLDGKATIDWTGNMNGQLGLNLSW